MVANDSEEDRIVDDLKGHPAGNIHPCFPNPLGAFDLFRMQGGMMKILGKELNLFVDFFPSGDG